ncbi:unnamed protein product [Prorocentrum cordatum]|uniref:Uncharacterized protein n=1 Tax=Prorocentrum cordatum TaxID=2364126 RepID=A0ABN9WAG2_9DINO|nr:unnamed protein product [Polarella glacialis]
MSSSFTDRLKEYHRSLRPKTKDELSMKQVACFFGGLYAIIHLLGYFDLWTLGILTTVGYVVYRQVQSTWMLVAESTEETRPVPNPKTKAGKALAKQRSRQSTSEAKS